MCNKNNEGKATVALDYLRQNEISSEMYSGVGYIHNEEDSDDAMEKLENRINTDDV